MFERKELIELSNRAKEMAKTEGLNAGWKRVYERLEDAASELDAYIARCTVVDAEK